MIEPIPARWRRVPRASSVSLHVLRHGPMARPAAIVDIAARRVLIAATPVHAPGVGDVVEIEVDELQGRGVVTRVGRPPDGPRWFFTVELDDPSQLLSP